MGKNFNGSFQGPEDNVLYSVHTYCATSSHCTYICNVANKRMEIPLFTLIISKTTKSAS